MNREQQPSSYFGRSLEEICQDERIIPLFVDRCIEFVEEKGTYFIISLRRMMVVVEVVVIMMMVMIVMMMMTMKMMLNMIIRSDDDDRGV